MFSRFFIDRPVFAGVVAIVIVIAGLVTLTQLPVALYPEISPPTVVVSATYVGANAQTVVDTVTTPLEQQINGVEGMIYMSSQTASDGSSTITVTFEIGVDLDMATVLVQNRVNTAMATLPEEVKRTGVTTQKKSTNFVQMIELHSPDGKFDELFLSNYAALNVQDVLARVPGVGSVSILGGSMYGMRIWLNPERLTALSLTTTDVVNAIKEQNVQVAAGMIGQPPVPKGQSFQLTCRVPGRLSDPEEFRNIILKTGKDGQITRIRDVARVELGGQDYSAYSQLNGKPACTIMIYQLPGANALAVAEGCKASMEELSKQFPAGLAYAIAFDASWFVNASMNEVVTTLFIAVLLVILTVFFFLQDWRASLIPAVTIPVSLIGAFIVMSGLGFSVNTLTMFGLVLAIGIVVDDAIVVVENVTRHIDESGMTPRDAAIKAMTEVTGPVIATTLVLLAVFVPTAFMEGITGQLYRQFALTIATAVCFSSLNALTLSPALCALLMRPTRQKRNFVFRLFEDLLTGTRRAYGFVVARTVRMAFIMFVLFAGFSVLAYIGFVELPTGFLPEEDQGYFMVNVQLPDAASLERTGAVLKRCTKMIAETPGVENTVGICGYSLLEGAVSSNCGAFVVILKRWDERTTPELQIGSILNRLRRKFSVIQEGVVFPFVTPAIPGLGRTGGFSMEVQDRADLGLHVLQEVAGQLILDANQQPDVVGAYTGFRANVPQLKINVNREKVKTMGVRLADVFDTLQAYLGSAYVNDFTRFGRTYRVMVQAEGQYRARPEQIRRLEVRNEQGDMVPLGTVCDIEETLGPQIISRYNLYPSASVTGNSASGYSSGDAVETMESLAARSFPAGVGYEWSGMTYQEIKAGAQAPFIFGLAVLMVYLFLAAQYESWTLPISVILSVPFAILGGAAALWMRGMDNNVYTQIGVVMLIGLSTKSAILIVEFAKVRRDEGMTRHDAAIEAAKLRFRAILMTAFSDILGWLPLVIATGAGAQSRRALGTAVFGGMIGATLIGVIFVPVLYVIVQSFVDWRAGPAKPKPDPAAEAAAPPPEA